MNSDDDSGPDGPTTGSRRNLASRARAYVAGMSGRARVAAATGSVVVLLAAAVVLALPDTTPGPGVAVNDERSIGLLKDEPTVPPSEKPSDGGSEKPAAVDDKPQWTLKDVGADAGDDLLPTADGYVLYSGTGGQLVGLDAEGTKTWDKSINGGNFTDVQVSDDVVMISEDDPDKDARPGQSITTVLDASSGKKLWKDTETTRADLSQDTVYTSFCQGGPDGLIVDCQLSAREPKTGKTRWTTPGYYSVRISDASRTGSKRSAMSTFLKSFVIIESQAAQDDDGTISVLDSKTGEPGASFDGDGSPLAGSETLIRVGDDDNPADGCEITLTAWNAETGAEEWERQVGVVAEDGGAECGYLPDAYADRLMALNGKGKPMVIDLSDGKTKWTAPSTGVPIAATYQYALIGRPGEKHALYDIDEREKLWESKAALDYDSPRFAADQMLVTTAEDGEDDPCWVRLGHKTGDPEAYPGQCVSSHADWVATADDGDVNVYALD